MKLFIRFSLGVVALLWVIGCGREPQRSLPSEEEVSKGETTREVSPALILNTVAGVAQKVIGEKEEGLSPVILAHGMPKGLRPFDLEKCMEREEIFEKEKRSALGFVIARIKYKISYQFGCRYKGKGNYLANIAFTPLEVDTDPIYSVRATGVSEEALNLGKPAAPVASIKFVVSFTVSGFGAQSVTDVFKVNGQSGNLEKSLGQF